MKTYTVYFDFNGKKLKKRVQAKDAEDARNQIRALIHIHKIQEHIPEESFNNDETVDFLKSIFNIK